MKKTLLALAFTTLFASHAFAEPQTLKETDIEETVLKVHHEVEQGGYELLSVADLKKLLDEKESLVLIDARPAAEFNTGFIDGANNFEFQSTFTRHWKDDATGGGQDAYKALLGHELNKKVVVYCVATKCGRSHTAALWTKELGYHHVYRAVGGLKAWQDAGFSVQTAKK